MGIQGVEGRGKGFLGSREGVLVTRCEEHGIFFAWLLVVFSSWWVFFSP